MADTNSSNKLSIWDKMKNEKITAFFFCLPALIPLIVFWIGPMIFAFI